MFCLLTPPAGLADATSAQAWAGLQDVSLKTHVQVRYLAVAGSGTPGTDGPFHASLVGEHCRAVVVAGASEAQAAEDRAAQFPGTQFLLLGGSDSGRNISTIYCRGIETLRGAVARAMGPLETE